MVAGVIGSSNSSAEEHITQNLDGGQGVMWEGPVSDGDSVPAIAIGAKIGSGSKLCRGTWSEEKDKRHWRDIGVVRNDRCHTLRDNEDLQRQDEFFYLVPDSEAQSTEVPLSNAEPMVPVADVDAVIEYVAGRMQERRERADVLMTISGRCDEFVEARADSDESVSDSPRRRIEQYWMVDVCNIVHSWSELHKAAGDDLMFRNS